MRHMLLVACLCGMVVVNGYAQEEPASAPADVSGVAGTPEGAEVAPAAPEQTGPRGDVVTLRTGTVLQDVQVLGLTAEGYLIEVVPGSVTMTLPRKMVVSVDYDDYSPGDEIPLDDAQPVAEAAPVEPGLAELFPGDSRKIMVPEAWLSKLSADVSGFAPGYDGKALKEVLARLSKDAGIPIVADKPVLEMPQDSLVCRLELEPETALTVGAFLYNHLLKQAEFRLMTIAYGPDQVLLTTKAQVSQARGTVGGESTAADAAGADTQEKPSENAVPDASG